MHSSMKCAAFVASLSATAPAAAEDLVFMLDNQSSLTVSELYASPADVENWEEDILGQDVLPSGESVRVTIADGSEQCDYDLRIVAEDGQTIEDSVNLCETGSYTVND